MTEKSSSDLEEDTSSEMVEHPDPRPYILTAVALVVYGLAFPLLHPHLGPATITFALVPVALAAQLLGSEGGILVALVTFPLHSVLLFTVGELENWPPLSGVVGTAVLVGAGSLIGRYRDVTEHYERAEKEATWTQEVMSKTFKGLDDAVLILDNSHPPLITDCNPTAIMTFGYGRNDLEGKTTEFLFEDQGTSDRFQAEVHKVIKTLGYCSFIEYRMLRRDGSVFPTEHSVFPLEDKNGWILGWVYVIRDLTDRSHLRSKLRKSEARYSELMESLPVCVYEADLRGTIIYANRVGFETFGYTPKDLSKGLSIIEMLAPEDRKRGQQAVLELIENRGAAVSEYLLVRKDGTTFPAVIHTKVVTEGGRPLSLRGIIIDITERNQAEKELDRHREHLEELVEERTNELAFLSRTAMGFVEQGSGDDIWRYIGEHLHELVPDAIIIISDFDEDMWRFEVRFFTGLGRTLSKVKKLLGRDLQGLTVTGDDEALERLRSGTMVQVPGGVHTFACGSMPKNVCSSIERVLGIGPIYSMGLVWEGRLYGSASIITRKVSALPGREAVETFVRQASVALRRQRAEEELRKHRDELEELVEERTRELKVFRTLIDRSSDAIFVVDPETGRFLDVNESACKNLGYSREELLGLGIVDIGVLLHDLPSWKRHVKDVRKKGKLTMEGHQRHKDGTTFPVETNVTYVEVGKNAFIVAVARDITQRLRTEKELEVQEEFSRTVLASMQEGLTIVDKAGVQTYVNPAFCRMTGYDEDELIGKSPPFPYWPEEEVPRYLKLFRKGIADGAEGGVTLELTYKRRNGEPFDVALTPSPIVETDGKVTSWIAVVQDVTEHKRADERLRRQVMTYDLESGHIYLVKERTPGRSIEAFKDMLNIGFDSLAISRTPEEEFRERVKGEYRFLWLAEKKGGNAVRPDVPHLTKLINSLPHRSAVLLDRLDYLITKAGFDDTLTLVQRMREAAYLSDHVIVLSLDPDIVDPRSRALLEDETSNVEPREGVRLPEDHLDILRLVNRRNLQGEKPTFTEIGHEVGLSRPTVRAKMKQLVSTGHVAVLSRGRTKVIELTDKGRRLFDG